MERGANQATYSRFQLLGSGPLIRRNTATGEPAFYRCFPPGPANPGPAGQGRRDPVGRRGMLPDGEGSGGPGPVQVRGWIGWRRFITLAMLALPLLTVMAVKSWPAPPVDPRTDTYIALTAAVGAAWQGRYDVGTAAAQLA